MNIKKIICLAATLTLLSNLSACENKKTSSSETEISANVSTNETKEITVQEIRNHDVAPASDFEYEEDDEGISINSYNGDDSICVIPEEIDGKPVTFIHYIAFADNKKVKAIYIPSGVTELSGTYIIADNVKTIVADNIENFQVAFNGKITNLQTIDLGNNLMNFSASYSFAEGPVKIHIPVGVVNIPDELFAQLSDEEKAQSCIVGEIGSAAEKYANTYNIPFSTEW
ncbi:MAG: hypothetical protein ACI4I6_02245 [Hominimerdicola sp.]